MAAILDCELTGSGATFLVTRHNSEHPESSGMFLNECEGEKVVCEEPQGGADELLAELLDIIQVCLCFSLSGTTEKSDRHTESFLSSN